MQRDDKTDTGPDANRIPSAELVTTAAARLQDEITEELRKRGMWIVPCYVLKLIGFAAKTTQAADCVCVCVCGICINCQLDELALRVEFDKQRLSLLTVSFNCIRP